MQAEPTKVKNYKEHNRESNFKKAYSVKYYLNKSNGNATVQ